MSLYHPIAAGSLSLRGNLFLAPVAGYTDRTFRTLCIEAGADFTYTELASAEALIRSSSADSPTFKLIQRGEGEERYAVQLFGSEPEVLYKAALLLEPLHPEAVDINSGCPAPKVVKTGAGSALMRDPSRLGRVVEAAARASREALGSVPVTVKIRSGWDAGGINYRECARIAAEAGAAMICLHPRTRTQNYAGKSDWSHIGDLVSRIGIPVIGSGDLFSPEDGERMLRETGCAAVMFARGAQGNPFIFPAARSLLCTGSYQPPGYDERIRTAFRHLALLSRERGEAAACREMRKQFCAYMKGSFGEPGIPGGAALRNRLVHAETIAQYQEILQYQEIRGVFVP